MKNSKHFVGNLSHLQDSLLRKTKKRIEKVKARKQTLLQIMANLKALNGLLMRNMTLRLIWRKTIENIWIDITTKFYLESKCFTSFNTTS